MFRDRAIKFVSLKLVVNSSQQFFAKLAFSNYSTFQLVELIKNLSMLIYYYTTLPLLNFDHVKHKYTTHLPPNQTQLPTSPTFEQ